jgi:uncharacterized protein YkwD
MESPAHYVNVLDNRLQEIGIGLARGRVADDSPVGFIWVADLGGHFRASRRA